MSQAFETLKQVSEVWPVITFIGFTIYGYVKLRFKVEDLEEKLKNEKAKYIEDRDEIEGDIKGVSIKTNKVMADMVDEFKAVRKENSSNHLEASKTISELKGMILVLVNEKK